MYSIVATSVLSRFSFVQLFATLWTVACQAPLSMGFSRQKYWSRLPFPSPGDLLNPEIESVSPASEGWFFTTLPPGKPEFSVTYLAFPLMFLRIPRHSL